MCGRYTLHKTADDIVKRFNLAKVPPDLRASFNVSPSQVMPVITQDDSGTWQLELMRWGITRTIGKDRRRDIFNTRDDKLFGGFWKNSALHRRCLVPADGYFEWSKITSGKERKRKYFYHPRGVELFAFAGIWDTVKDSTGQELGKAYSIITTSANSVAAQVHDRMPVILHQDDEMAWLQPADDDQSGLEPLLRPYEDRGLEVVEVDNSLNAFRFNDERLVYPLNSR